MTPKCCGIFWMVAATVVWLISYDVRGYPILSNAGEISALCIPANDELELGHPQCASWEDCKGNSSSRLVQHIETAIGNIFGTVMMQNHVLCLLPTNRKRNFLNSKKSHCISRIASGEKSINPNLSWMQKQNIYCVDCWKDIFQFGHRVFLLQWFDKTLPWMCVQARASITCISVVGVIVVSHQACHLCHIDAYVIRNDDRFNTHRSTHSILARYSAKRLAR